MEKKYEGCFLLKAELSDEEVEKEAEFISNNILEAGGTLVKKELMGKRELAYPINKKTEAIYYIFYFISHPEQLHTIRSSFERRDNIVRYLLMQKKRLPKEDKENGGTKPE
jgi:small subunit ribosomal protein S6